MPSTAISSWTQPSLPSQRLLRTTTITVTTLPSLPLLLRRPEDFQNDFSHRFMALTHPRIPPLRTIFQQPPYKHKQTQEELLRRRRRSRPVPSMMMRKQLLVSENDLRLDRKYHLPLASPPSPKPSKPCVDWMKLWHIETPKPATFVYENSFPSHKIGAYSPKSRAKRIQRFHELRKRRNFKRTVVYTCRQRLASTCPRIRGRFVRKQSI